MLNSYVILKYEIFTIRVNVILEQLLDEINSSTEQELSHVDKKVLKGLLQKIGEKFISKNLF